MSADLLARLIEAGTPAALVAEVALLAARAEAAEKVDPVAERRRAWDRDYRAEKRAREKEERLSALSGGQSGCRVDNADIPAPSPSPLPSPQTPQPTPHPHPHPEGSDARTRKARPSGWPCPEGVDPSHWADLIANRKSKRLANTPTALAGILRDIAKHADDEWPPGRIVQHAAERGWGAIFDPRPSTQGRHADHRKHHQSADRQVDGFTSALRRASAQLDARDAC